MLDRIRSFFGARAAVIQKPGRHVMDNRFGDQMAQDLRVGRTKDRKSIAREYDASWAGICAAKTAQVASKSRFYVAQALQDRNGIVRTARLYNHPLTNLLARPNPHMSAAQVVAQLEATLTLYNEAFLLVDFDRGIGGTPTALWPERPDRLVAAVSTKDYITHWWHQPDPNGDPIKLETKQVIHFKRGGAAGGHRPLTPIQQQSFAIDASRAVEVYSVNMVENGGRLDLVLETQSDNADEVKRAREIFAQGVKSARRQHGILATGFGARVTPLNLKPADLEFIQLAKMSRDQICAALGVPLVVLGVADGTAAAGPAIKEMRRAWLKDVIDADLRLIADTLAHSLMPLWPQPKSVSSWHEVVYDTPMERDDLEYIRAQQIQVMTGLRTPNELRAQDGYAPHSGWGDAAVSPNGEPYNVLAEIAVARLENMRREGQQQSGNAASQQDVAAEMPDSEDNAARSAWAAFVLAAQAELTALAEREAGKLPDAVRRRLAREDMDLLLQPLTARSARAARVVAGVLREGLAERVPVEVLLGDAEAAWFSTLSLPTHE